MALYDHGWKWLIEKDFSNFTLKSFLIYLPIMKPGRIYLSLTFLIIITSLSWITSCSHDADISNLPEMCFERDVLPIFSNSCAISHCHDGSGEAFPLNSYAQIMNTVTPYNPDKSQCYKAITTTWGEGRMPPDQPLSQEKRTIIRLWIEQGANETGTTCPQAASVYPQPITN
jgi:hypothetical protein